MITNQLEGILYRREEHGQVSSKTVALYLQNKLSSDTVYIAVTLRRVHWFTALQYDHQQLHHLLIYLFINTWQKDQEAFNTVSKNTNGK